MGTRVSGGIHEPTPDGQVECSARKPENTGRAASAAARLASDLLYWKGGLKILRQAQLPKWRGYFKWQIEAKIEALQTEYAKLSAEAAGEGG